MLPSLTLIDPARTTKLQHLVKDARESKAETYPLIWRGERIFFPVINVETDWVLLNLDNGRTRAEQELEARDANDPELFSDPASSKAQDAQARILRKQDPAAFKALFNDLRGRGQREPGVVTAAGVLVNGNRRCVALRDIGVQYMTVVVLPEGALPKEIRALEVELQIARDFREDYSDVNRLLVIEQLLNEDHCTIEEVARRLRLTERDVQTERGILALMKEYLQVTDGLQLLADLDGTYQVFKETYVRIKELEAKSEFLRADRLKHNKFAAIFAGTGYREARNVDERFVKTYVVSALKNAPAVGNIILAPRPSEPHAPEAPLDLGPLAGLSAADDEQPDLAADLLRKMVKLGHENKPQGIPVAGGSATTVLDSVRDLIRAAAQEATQDARDERNSGQPVTLVEEATNKIRKINLDRAIAAGGFNPETFLRALQTLEESIQSVRKSLDALGRES